MLWSDPEEIEGWARSPGGSGMLLGWKFVFQFNLINNIDLITRSHQLCMDGYKYWYEKKNLVTIWSAPNYCHRSGNIASYMQIDQNLKTQIKTFEANYKDYSNRKGMHDNWAGQRFMY